MPLNLPQVPFKLTREDMGVPDYGKAMREALQSAGMAMETAYKPSSLAEELLNKQLLNKKLQNEMRLAQQKSQQEESFNKLFNQALLGNQPNAIPGLRDKVQAGIFGQTQQPQGLVSPENIGLYSRPSERDELGLNDRQQFVSPQTQDVKMFMGEDVLQNKQQPGGYGEKAMVQVVSPGNPALESINQMYDNYPQYRQLLESRGFTKKQEMKFDQKTGNISLITTYPNGKVEVSRSGATDKGEMVPLTQASATKLQNVVTSVDNAIPALKKLSEFNTPVKGVGAIWTPGKTARYNSLIAELTEQLLGAFTLNTTDATVEMVKNDILNRKKYESDDDYHKRIKETIEDLQNRKERAKKALKAGISTEFNPREMSDEALSDITGEQ